jgi:hypothetical protein
VYLSVENVFFFISNQRGAEKQVREERTVQRNNALVREKQVEILQGLTLAKTRLIKELSYLVNGKALTKKNVSILSI